MSTPARLFYQYSGAHSFVIGLLPFFLPTLMWMAGAKLSEISWFIALNGVGYMLTLYLWDRLRAGLGWRLILIISFILELTVVAAIVIDQHFVMIQLIGLLNGAYSCFFWMSQRTLFIHCSDRSNTGTKFGNFQIIVMVMLKAGILLGAYLWEVWGANAVLLVTTGFLIPVIVYLRLISLPRPLIEHFSPAVSLKSVFHYRDRSHSCLIFFADGLFLFAESYFWVISLYLVSGESLVSLGILVVSLSILLAILFYLIKNRLDNMNRQRIYVIAVAGYAISWYLRGNIDMEQDKYWIYPAIVIIAFLTALFRLTFNKRFFDLASDTSHHQYIVIKSYYSQLAVVLWYAIAGIGFLWLADPLVGLQVFYWLLAPLSLVYLLYKADIIHPSMG